MHGVTHTIERIREQGVPGWEVEVIGTDPRRRPAPARRRRGRGAVLPGLTIGVPSVPELVETLADGRYDLVHVCRTGPGRDRRGAHRADRRPAAARQLPHRARLPTPGCAAATRRWRPACASRSRSSTASARSCSRRAPRPTSPWPGSGSSADGSGAGTAASTSRCTTRLGAIPAPTRVRSRCCTPAG